VDGEMGRWGDGEMGRWGDGEMGATAGDCPYKRIKQLCPCPWLRYPASREKDTDKIRL